MNDQMLAALKLLPFYLSQHVLLSASALGLALIISMITALAVYSRPRARSIALTLARTVQTIPGLAMIALFYPLLLFASGATMALFGFSLPSFGFLPALLALITFAILPILQGIVLGLTTIDADVIEAADAMGMTRRDRLILVEAPLAAPIAMAGLRTAAVWTIGAATLATPVGQTSLGNYIFTGLQTENWIFVIVGCAAAASLALTVDGLLSLFETGFRERDLKAPALGVFALGLGLYAALASAPTTGAAHVIGAKNFSEQFILSELIADRLRSNGRSVSIKTGLGSAVIFRALQAGDIDVYVDYSGTLWTNVMGRTDTLPKQEMIDQISRWMEKEGISVLGPLGFENAYGIVMRRDRATELGIKTVRELTSHAAALNFGSDLEFTARPEWRSVRDTYHLSFREVKTYDPTLMYRALQTGYADVISGFTSDGRIAAMDLVVLEDPENALPAYDALLLIAKARKEDDTFVSSLRPMLSRISVDLMREANYMVDRDSNKQTPAQAARFLQTKLNGK